MSAGHDIKASLSIYLQTEDTYAFSDCLSECRVHYTQLCDPMGYNIFHDLGNCIIKEDYLLRFLNIMVEKFKDRYNDQSPIILKEMLNCQTSTNKQTPLLLAITHNRIVISIQKLIKEFLTLGADARIKDVNQHGPMHLCASLGRTSLFVYFNSLGIGFEEEDINNHTPLFLSAREGHETTGLLIIAWSKDLNKIDKEGRTPLHLAAMSGNYKIVRHLLMNGAVRSCVDHHGKTPLDIAREESHKDLVRILVRIM